MKLELRENTLVVCVDGSGHEALVEGHPVYGLGGCVALARDFDRLIRHPWHEVRRQIVGSPDAPLHAASFSRQPSEREITVLSEFFRKQGFARIGATVSRATQRGGLSPVQIIAGVLKNRIVDIARWTSFTEVSVIFESGRADRLIEEAFGDFRLEENGRNIPVECYFMPKSAGDASLEVADFIMHAVGRQARRRIEGRDGFAPDFAAVFHGQDPKQVSYMEVAEVQQSKPGAASLDYESKPLK